MERPTALITGASSGIGAATARAFAQAGWDLILMARRKDRLERLSAELSSSAGAKASTFALDLSRSSDLSDWTSRHANELSKVSALINNAGLARGMTAFPESRASEWAEMIDVNIRAVLELTHAMIPHFKKAGRGHIVNLGSVAGRWIYPKGHVYCMTKAAIGAFTQALRHDLMGLPIRVTEISPGMVETEFSQVRLGDAAQAKAVYAGMKPLTAEDVAESILWCVSRPAHVNVQELVLYPVDQAAPGFVARR